MMRGLIIAALMAVPCIAHASDATGTITILEGDALIYRGLGRLHAAEGVRLAVGDIVETGPSAFMQIELSDNSAVQFGPTTRALINAAPARRGRPERWLFIMNGWAKVAGAGERAGAPGYDVRTRPFWMTASPATIVLRTAPAETTLFVERGEVRLAEQQAAGAPVPVSLKQGDYYLRKAGTRGAVSPEAKQAFLAQLPRSFRDSLPRRIDRFRDQEVKPKDAPDFTYADVEPWLKAEPWLRRPLVQRWRAKAHEPAFRASLIANLSAHPEWDPILFPEKYLPKEHAARRPQAAAENAASALAPSSNR